MGHPLWTSLLHHSSAQIANLKSFHWYSNVYSKAEELPFLLKQGCMLNLILDWDFPAVMYHEERGRGSFCKLLPISLLTTHAGLILTKPCDERKPWLYPQVTSWAKGEKAVRRRAENMWAVSAGGKSRILLCEGGSREGDVHVWILLLYISRCLLGREN